MLERLKFGSRWQEQFEDASQGGIIQEESLAEPQAPQPRQAITREDVRNASITEGCLGCIAAVSGDTVGSHWASCRRKLEENGEQKQQSSGTVIRCSPKRRRKSRSCGGGGTPFWSRAPAPQESATHRGRFAQSTQAVDGKIVSSPSSSSS